ncbi:nickel/cobalt transporter [Fulvimarina sp. 2208YS6-2-32]|uniref:Nickel/cobalt efflux system n=1 Tax=Fulvimarina uroteuthidis TaxID=3098149 RepID=A0ABU5HXL0_9HYPH|nr:nickel/cobalt transporter [Fulvimarina sp. 2208YS6-2-32]MDY8107879.1 nickel/cobalt transporter [Fulvimarina sp. 2208YS6-2-32]
MTRLSRVLGSLLVIGLAGGEALARSSLGIGTAEVAAPVSDGIFSGLFTQIALWQREFFSALRHALVSLKRGDDGFLYLVGLSFAYGVFHAAGPGHGKAVISAYMLASRAELKRGVFLSFVSSLVQAVSALVLVGLGWFFLRGTAVSMTDATDWAELASYALVFAVGLWLLARACGKLVREPLVRSGVGRSLSPFRRMAGRDAAFSSQLAFASQADSDWRGGETAGKAAAPARVSSLSLNARPAQATSISAAEGFDRTAVCADDPDDCGCGRAHMPAPHTLSSPLTLKSGVAAVFAVGLRPCSGAIVILTFGLLNGLYLGGVLSVFAMALGTAITVSVLASLTVLGRGALERAGRFTPYASLLARVLEIAGALLLMLLGVGLLGGALAG